MSNFDMLIFGCHFIDRLLWSRDRISQPTSCTRCYSMSPLSEIVFHSHFFKNAFFVFYGRNICTYFNKIVLNRIEFLFYFITFIFCAILKMVKRKCWPVLSIISIYFHFIPVNVIFSSHAESIPFGYLFNIFSLPPRIYTHNKRIKMVNR